MADKLTPLQRAFLDKADRRMELRYIIETQNLPPNFCADELKLLDYVKAAGMLCDIDGHVDAGIIRREDGGFREEYRTEDGRATFYMETLTKVLTLGLRPPAKKEPIFI